MAFTDTIRNADRATMIKLSAVGLVALPLAAGFFGNIHPALDSFSHFRVHLAVLLIVVAVPLFATRFLKLGALAAFFGIMAIASTSGTVPVPGVGIAYGPLYPPVPEQPVYTLLQLNLLFDNEDKARALSLIGRVQPDVMTLNEVSEPWHEKLGLIASAYPYSIFCPFPNSVWGVAILSRRPFVAGTTPRCDGRGAFAVASLDFGGQAVEIASLHLAWPWPREQAWQIDGLTDDLGTLGPTTILAGDMNATPWSHTVARIASAGHLALMPSPGPTWLQTGIPEALRFAGLPIDQVFATPAIMVHGISRLENVGSDHLPVIVQFSLRPGSGQKGTGETATASASRAHLPKG